MWKLFIEDECGKEFIKIFNKFEEAVIFSETIHMLAALQSKKIYKIRIEEMLE